MNLNVPSSSSSSFSDLDSFKKEGDEFLDIAGFSSDSEKYIRNWLLILIFNNYRG
jgi:hypothetical protein